MRGHLLISGVPATGKTRLGEWLSAEEGYLHLDAELPDDAGFHALGVHGRWGEAFQSGRSEGFVSALDALTKPVVMTWGFPPHCLFMVKSLIVAGMKAWWLSGDTSHARAAYVRRYNGGDPRHPSNFDRQLAAVDQQWLLIASVFGEHVVPGLSQNGQQRHPREIWEEMRGGA